MAETFFWFYGDYDYVVQIHQRKQPPHSCQDTIHGSLRSYRGASQSEWHANASVQSMLERECGFILVRFIDFYLPVSATRVYRWKDCGLAKTIHVLIHSWDNIRFKVLYSVLFPVVSTDSKSFVFLWLECNYHGPFSLSGFDYLLFQHFV